jgi:hypothetical protein
MTTNIKYDITKFDSIIQTYIDSNKPDRILNRLITLDIKKVLKDICNVKYNIKLSLKKNQKFYTKYDIIEQCDITHKKQIIIIKLTLLEYLSRLYPNNVEIISLLLKYSEITPLVVENIFIGGNTNLFKYILNNIDIETFQFTNIVRALGENTYINRDAIIYLINLGFDINREYDIYFKIINITKDSKSISYIKKKTTILEDICFIYRSDAFDFIKELIINYKADINYGASLLYLINYWCYSKEIILQEIFKCFNTDKYDINKSRKYIKYISNIGSLTINYYTSAQYILNIINDSKNRNINPELKDLFKLL